MSARLLLQLSIVALLLAVSPSAEAKLVLGRLVVHGRTTTTEDAFFARMRLRPGEPVDLHVLEEAEERLVASDLFVSVRVWLDMPDEVAVRKMYLEPQVEPVDVHLTVDEKHSWFVVPTGSLGGGDKAIGAAYGDENLRGRGTQLVFAGQYGESKSYVFGGFRDPIVSFLPLTYGFAGVFRLEDFRFYENHRLIFHVPTRVIGGEGQIGWVVSPTLRLLVGVLYNHSAVFLPRADDPTVGAPIYNDRGGHIVTGQLYLLYDDSTAPEGLREGTRISLRNEVSDRFWGSDFEYVKSEFALELYGRYRRTFPSLSFRTVFNYPTSERGVPLTQLQRAGGPDLRGYYVNEFRGDTLVSLQLENQLQIYKGLPLPVINTRLNLAAAVFLDTGVLLERHPGGIAGATARQPTPGLDDFHTGIGAGIRLLVPGVAIPAVKIDLAYGIDVNDVAVTVSIAGSGR